MASNVENIDPWDLDGTPETGPSYQPWRKYWPQKNIDQLSAEELKQRPWLTWKRDNSKPNDKPWYKWVNDFGSLTTESCNPRCPHCGGEGCVSALRIS
jgi:hypothetical protein